jgi:hypothetical protein
MIITVCPLTDLEVSARMICEGPLCHASATHRAMYAYALDGDEGRVDTEVVCDRHAEEIRQAIADARKNRAHV